MKNNRQTAAHPANSNGVQRISLSHPFVSIALPPFILPFLPFSFLLLSLFSLFESLPFVHFYLKREKLDKLRISHRNMSGQFHCRGEGG
jgi:hypothetical protein